MDEKECIFNIDFIIINFVGREISRNFFVWGYLYVYGLEFQGYV